jgi:hypothetical protein
MKTVIKLFELTKIRSIWNEVDETWYFSIVDVIAILTNQSNFQSARNYWKVLKNRLSKEGNETVTNCNRLKLVAEDGKMRLTDVMNIEQFFRLVQSIPSPKAEPFKLWLAMVARERIDEIEDPEKGIDRIMDTYINKGYSKEWVNQRIKSIEVRKELTNEWENRGVKKGQEFAY